MPLSTDLLPCRATNQSRAQDFKSNLDPDCLDETSGQHVSAHCIFGGEGVLNNWCLWGPTKIVARG